MKSYQQPHSIVPGLVGVRSTKWWMCRNPFKGLYRWLLLLLLMMILILWYICPRLIHFGLGLAYIYFNGNEVDHHICPSLRGRLGNNMFQYAAAYGLASEKNMSVLLSKETLIGRYFDVDADIREYASHICSAFPSFQGPPWGIYNMSFLAGISRNHSVRLEGYFQSYKWFDHVRFALKEQFLSFTGETKEKAMYELQNVKNNYKTKLNVHTVTIIGVHVRRGDKLKESEVKDGNRAAPREYFLKAMDYFTSKYNNCAFIVRGDDQPWATENLPSKYNVVYLNLSFTPDVDLAILSMCDHMIMSIGTYSWWAAYLNGGEVVYYQEWITLGSDLYKNYRQDDYFLPEWTPM